MHIIWITTQFPNGKNNRDGMFIYRTVQALGNNYKLTVFVLYPIIPPIIPMLKKIKDWRKIYSNWRNAFPRKPEKPEGLELITVCYVKYIRPPRVNYLDIEGWFAFFFLNKYFKKFNQITKTIIHAAWIFPAGQAAELLARKFKIPYVVTLMGSDVNFIQQNTLRHKSAKKVINNANKVTSVSKALINELIKRQVPINNSKTALTHTIYNFSKFSIIDRNSARHQLGIDEKKKIIFFAGMLRPLKNTDVLIKSTRSLLDENIDLILIIAGSGYEEGNLKRLVINENMLDRVRFVGNIDENTIVKYYNAADVFCLPSQNEGLPNVIVESLLCGTPVVATKVGEIPFIICDGKNGCLVETDSVSSLAMGLKMSLNSKWDRHSLRESVSFLSPQNVISEYNEVYSDIYEKYFFN